MFLPPGAGLASRGYYHNLGLFFQDLFLSEPDYGLVSTRRACYQFLWPFSTPVDSPSDQREIGGCRNRGLRFGIRADYGRIRAQLWRVGAQLVLASMMGGFT